MLFHFIFRQLVRCTAGVGTPDLPANWQHQFVVSFQDKLLLDNETLLTQLLLCNLIDLTLHIRTEITGMTFYACYEDTYNLEDK